MKIPGAAAISLLLAWQPLCLAQTAKSAPDYFNDGCVKQTQHDYKGALADFDHAVALDPQFAAAYYRRDLVSRAAAPNGEAGRDYGRWKELGPQETPAFDDYIQLKCPWEDPRKALAFFMRAIASDPKNAVLYYRRGVTKAALGEIDGAIADFEQAIALHAEFPDAFLRLGVAKDAKEDVSGWKDIEEAIRLYENAMGRDPNQADNYRNRGLARFAENSEGSMEDFNHVIELDPQDAVACDGRGLDEKKEGEPDKAIADFTRAISLDPRNAAYYAHRGNARLANGDLDGAITDYGMALTLNAAYPNAYNNRGLAKAAKGDVSGAIADYNAALALNARYANAFNNRAIAKYRLGDFKGALDDCNAALSIDERYYEALNSRALIKMALGDMTGAVSDADQTYRTAGTYAAIAKAYAACADNELTGGDIDNASSNYRAAIEIDPGFIPPYIGLGSAEEQLGNSREALESLDKAIALDATSAAAYDTRGTVKAAAGEWTKAIADYDRAAALDPKSPGVFNHRGEARQATGDHAGALRDFEKAIALDPNFARAHYNRGVERLAAGNAARAKEDFDRALALNPKYEAACYERGMAGRALGDNDGALADFETVIRLNPKNDLAHDQCADIRQAKGDKAGATADRAAAWNVRGFAKYDCGDAAAAVAVFDKAVASAPKNPDYYSGRGLAKKARGDLQGAVADYDRAIALDANNATTYHYRGLARVAQNSIAAAIADYDHAIAIDPGYAMAYFHRGCAKEIQGDEPGAQADLKKFMELPARAANSHDGSFRAAQFSADISLYAFRRRNGGVTSAPQILRAAIAGPPEVEFEFLPDGRLFIFTSGEEESMEWNGKKIWTHMYALSCERWVITSHFLIMKSGDSQILVSSNGTDFSEGEGTLNKEQAIEFFDSLKKECGQPVVNDGTHTTAGKNAGAKMPSPHLLRSTNPGGFVEYDLRPDGKVVVCTYTENNSELSDGAPAGVVQLRFMVEVLPWEKKGGSLVIGHEDGEEILQPAGKGGAMSSKLGTWTPVNHLEFFEKLCGYCGVPWP